jgi:hypothetical protein
VQHERRRTVLREGDDMAAARYDYFIAHAGADVAAAKALRELLVPALHVFLDACDLEPGTAWDAGLAKAQRESAATVALLSPATEVAYYLREEIASAIAYQRHEPALHRLIPVYLNGVPRDPAQIPYGLRALHALDAGAGGLEAVAAQLVQMASGLAAPPPPSPAPKADRFALYDALCALLPAMFAEVVFRLSAPAQHMAPASEPLSRRALDLVQWAEAQGDEKMRALDGAVRKVSPGVLR